jgi:hypothetical protein
MNQHVLQCIVAALREAPEARARKSEIKGF